MMMMMIIMITFCSVLSELPSNLNIRLETMWWLKVVVASPSSVRVFQYFKSTQ
jgi:hypothetical protein